jgi:hypothetical protein
MNILSVSFWRCLYHSGVTQPEQKSSIFPTLAILHTKPVREIERAFFMPKGNPNV